MDFKQLTYFVRVAELGSFTRAAIELNIAQPALSRQVRLLEVELRQNLLNRNGRGALPTPAGKLLLEHGRGILHQVAVARDVLGAARGALTGRVSIGLPPSLSRLITVPLTQAFREHLPDAQLALTEGFSLVMHEGLRNGNLDIAVLYNPERSPDMEAATLHEDELVLISANRARGRNPAPSKLAPVTLTQAAALPLILPSRPNAFRLLLEGEIMKLGTKPSIVMEVDGLNAILSLVREDVGHAVLPHYTLSNFDKQDGFTVREILSPRILSQLMMVWSARRPTTNAQNKAREILSEVVASAMRAWPASSRQRRATL